MKQKTRHTTPVYNECRAKQDTFKMGEEKEISNPPALKPSLTRLKLFFKKSIDKKSPPWCFLFHQLP
jgi:hypothetical protein